MRKLLNQIILLTRKNLKVRFSHRCLSFCELAIPLLIALSAGFLVSYQDDKGLHDIDSPSNGDGTAESKFDCGDEKNRYRYWGSAYNCEKWYDSVDNLTQKLSPSYFDHPYELESKVVFLVANKEAQNKEIQELVTEIINYSGISDENQTNYLNRQQEAVKWEQTNKSENELEICLVQRQPACNDIYAAVIFKELENDLKNKRIRVEYKIRMKTESVTKLFVDYRPEQSKLEQDDAESFYFFPNYPMPNGFIQLQTLIDRGIMDFVKKKLHKGGELPPNYFDNNQVHFSLVRMPYILPQERFLASRTILFSILHGLLGSLAIFSLMRVNTEKSSGFKELLRMHGVPVSTQWMAWLLSSFWVYFVWTLLLALALWIPFIGGANFLPIFNISFVLYWLLLLAFMMTLTTLSFLISVFFERVWTAASIGLLVWILLTVVMIMVNAIFYRLTTWGRIAIMLIPTVAFDFAFRLSLNNGGAMTNFGTSVIENVSLTWLDCFIMLLLDSVIYMLLAVYLDNVVPSKYGVSKSPWYGLRNFRKFIRRVTRMRGNIYDTSLMGNDSSRMIEMETELPSRFDNDQPFESDPENAKVAVVIKNLKKRYRNSKMPAVDGLSEKMFTGEIYTLLGFNGAGKTTTIGILTGLFAPTSGMASILGFDIKTDMEEIRRHIGLCPQHNLLYNEMSVLDQVAFFGKLKGLPEPEKSAKELLEWLGMTDKLFNTPEQLSGGQKRRVHLAIALIGDTKLAFLDEPTSGLDPESRRGVWDILFKLRGKVTVILTTHDMEEADVLGDRIGIMSEGKIFCSGTPLFLKKYYDVGYNLKMNAVSGSCDAERVLKFVQEYITGAKLNVPKDSTGDSDNETIQTVIGSGISISLPTAQLDRELVADLMEAMQQQKQHMGVDSIGLSLASMEDVFLKVGEMVQAVDVMLSSYDSSRNEGDSIRYEKAQLQWYRFWALVLKRAVYFCHAPFTMLFLILVFSLFLWLSLIGMYFIVSQKNELDPPRVVSSSSLSAYSSPIMLVHEYQQSDRLWATKNHRSFATSYKSTVSRYSRKSPNIHIKEFPNDEKIDDIFRYLKIASVQDPSYYRHHYLTGASFNYSKRQTNITGFFSAYALHGAPLSVNLISQARIKKMYDVEADINVVNHPLPNSQRLDYVDPKYLDHETFYFKALGQVILLVIMASLLTSTAAFLPTEERLNKGKQLQLMTGTTPFIYWMAMFSWDFVFFSFANVVITLVYILTESATTLKIFTGNGAGAVIYLILECHTFAALWFSYLVSWATCIKTPSDGFLLVNMFAVIVGVLCNVIRHVLVLATGYWVDSQNAGFFIKFLYYLGDLSSGYVLWPVPMHSLYLSMIKLAAVGHQNSVCDMFPADVLRLACENEFERKEDNSRFIYRCCGSCNDNCFQPQVHLTTDSVQLYGVYETHSIVFDIFAMLLSGFASASILYSLEYLLPRWRQNRVREQLSAGINTASPVEQEKEEDVLIEESQINDLVKRSGQSVANLGFIAHNLNLNFGKLKAVNGLSFSVGHGECFGLLGISGSGKTSTFRMITGDITPSSGNIFSGGLNYRENRSSYMARIGYCPQFDGIIGRLSGLQLVKLYGALRGIPPSNLEKEARIWLDKFGLLGSANKKCAAYSGGMKRRLSVAMALIGNPPLILLDEPTTGVDPAFRRQFWNVIREVKKRGQTIVLTSYTMNECEELCTRLGIMVEGQFKCLGNTGQLKNKFGNGYTLGVKLKKIMEEDERKLEYRVHCLHEKIFQAFTPCHIISQRSALIQYQLTNKSLWYSIIFREMENIRNDPDLEPIIEDYTVTDTSLEDVFISFAGGRQRLED